MKRVAFPILLLLAALPGAVFADGGFVDGLMRSDSLMTVPTDGSPVWSQSEEARISFSPSGQGWKALIDARFFYLQPAASLALTDFTSLLSGDLPELRNAIPLLGDAAYVNLARAWLRFDLPYGNLTVGRFWPKTGIFGIFNPFEWSKTIGFTDTSFDREGVDGASWNFGVTDTGEGQVFVAPGGSISNLAGGASLTMNALGFDFGVAALRKGWSTNVAGFYFKGDLLVGVNASWAFHFDDGLTNAWSEIYAGIDYSFDFGGPKLLLTGGAYYAAHGATNTNEYLAVTGDDRYLNARLYGLADASLVWDDSLTFDFIAFANGVDGSTVLIPQLKIQPWSAITVTLYAVFATGTGDTEFNRTLFGNCTLLARCEAKF
jgi:hypothetical protein